MKITGFDLFRFKLPLLRPFPGKTGAVPTREGLILRLTLPNGSVGLGEISPLPGLSTESLKEAQKQVLFLKSKILNQTPPLHCDQFDGSLERWLKPYHLFPSVVFGLESAIFNLLAEGKRAPLHRLLGSPSGTPIPLIGLLQGHPEAIVKETQRLYREGVRTFKLKVGHRDIQEDFAKIQKIKEAVKGWATLRLDANQAWSFQEAVDFANALPKDFIEYIEEPFKDPSPKKMRDFFRATGIPVALDESLIKMKPEELAPTEGLKAVILKPTLLGGLEKTLRFIKQAKKSGITPVISSSFETGVGLSTLAHLAYCNDGLPAGLDTLKWFRHDLVRKRKRIRLKKGKLSIPPGPLRMEDLNWKFFTRGKPPAFGGGLAHDRP